MPALTHKWRSFMAAGISFKNYEYPLYSLERQASKTESSAAEKAMFRTTAFSMLDCHAVVIGQIEFFVWINSGGDAFQKAVEQLANFESEVPLFIGEEEQWVPVGALVLYHLHMIQLNATPDQIKDDLLYSLMAYTNKNGCSSTVLQKMRAGRRARAEILLYALENALKAEDLRIVQECFAKLREVGIAMSLDQQDRTDELNTFNLDSREGLENHLKHIASLKQILKKKWNLP